MPCTQPSVKRILIIQVIVLFISEWGKAQIYKQRGRAGEHLGKNNRDIGLALGGQEMKWFIPSNGPFCILEAEI